MRDQSKLKATNHRRCFKNYDKPDKIQKSLFYRVLIFLALTSLFSNIVRVNIPVARAHYSVFEKEEPLSKSSPRAQDHAIYVRASGTYPDDAVILPVMETLEARYAAAGKEFTIEYWFRMTPGYDPSGELFDHHVPSNEGFWTAFQNDQLWAGIDTEPDNDNTAIHIHTGSGFNDGEWHHYALVRDLSTSPHQLCLYLDGKGSCYTDGSKSEWASVAEDIRPARNRDGDEENNKPLYVIGARTNGGGEIEATIDELRISDVARYRTDFTPVPTPFSLDAHTVMLFHFDEGEGNLTQGRDSENNLYEGVLVKTFDNYGLYMTPLDPDDPRDAAWLDEMWVAGRFGSTPSTVTLLAPNGGESWTVGTQQEIRWSSSGNVGNLHLAYSTDDFTTSHSITSATANDGVYTWTIPENPSTNVLVSVSSVITPSISDTSDAAFEISRPLSPTLTLLSPNGGELWLVGSQYPIKWTTTGTPITNVDLSYFTDDSPTILYPIATSVSNTGNYTWSTPIMSWKALRVRVADASNSELYDDSDGSFILTDIVRSIYLPVILKRIQ
jgi:hypothetical protein